MKRSAFLCFMPTLKPHFHLILFNETPSVEGRFTVVVLFFNILKYVISRFINCFV